MHFLNSRSRWRVPLLWMAAALVSAAWVFVAMNLRSPYLLAVREGVFWIWAITGSLAAIGLFFQGKRIFTYPKPFHLLTCSFLFGGVMAGHGRWLHFHYRSIVASSSHMPQLGNHLIIGWLGKQDTEDLAAKGAIAGVLLTSRNFPPGSTVVDIRRTVDELQAVRLEAGLPQLWIATDQEGGPVAKLSPPIFPQPALKTLLEDLDGPDLDGPDLADKPARNSEIVRRVTAYADAQGRELAEAGINLNFAPVVDLQPSKRPDLLDFHSRIATRALAADPVVVALAGETYVRTLAKHGITAVLKHFPGLGSVPADTHHFAATLDIPADILTANDWLPFREISKNTGTGIMLSHVRMNSLDPDHPISCSPAVVRLLRKDWGFHGLLVTDDFSMAPIFHGPGGIVPAARQSVIAGVDLILLSYDAEAVYDLLGAELRTVTR
jgi:beta-N-acetylhexosaminidase